MLLWAMFLLLCASLPWLAGALVEKYAFGMAVSNGVARLFSIIGLYLFLENGLFLSFGFFNSADSLTSGNVPLEAMFNFTVLPFMALTVPILLGELPLHLIGRKRLRNVIPVRGLRIVAAIVLSLGLIKLMGEWVLQ